MRVERSEVDGRLTAFAVGVVVQIPVFVVVENALVLALIAKTGCDVLKRAGDGLAVIYFEETFAQPDMILSVLKVRDVVNHMSVGLRFKVEGIVT